MTISEFQIDSADIPYGLMRKGDTILFDIDQINPWMLLLAEWGLPYANEKDLAWLPAWLQQIKEKKDLNHQVHALKKSVLKQ
jgi:hypothetical protein